ncbi:hypothetical protein DCCM_0584 [Desulfocucumis palustris]|uniref:Transposase IS200-like domain-containing protein n=1 Tax=Desulfocucumis palustris TaxID=1898651 RepID=A0A2L2X8Q1_9FIRM|nr:transposase [Desulfocucumis palustris]GBF32390.1 hypothetical protein DCCM_0584 [Desulfocucumis palustris]
MARQCREKSSTGIYHVMLRGIDKREIFLDDQDREKFLFYLSRAKEKSNYIIYGYCLMDNHVHLLIEEGHELIGESIKRITVGYVQWHNIKYSRTGHLFQNRYKSEAIEDDTYFLTALRYIHQNPIKAGLVQDISHYKWSSYTHYIEGAEQKLVSVDRGKGFFSSQDTFLDFMKMPNNDQCLEYEVNIKYTDKKLSDQILIIYNKPELIKSLRKEDRDNVIKEIKQCTGASNRQLSRVLGIGRGIIENVK